MLILVMGCTLTFSFACFYAFALWCARRLRGA